jgi:hypothetical protein
MFTEVIAMHTKEMPLIAEAPVIVVGLAVAAVGAAAYAAVLGTTRAVLHLTGLDRPTAATH